MVSQSQVLYTRSGQNLTLNPIGQPIQIHDVLPKYDFYFTDSWHMKPTFTLTYGLAYVLDLPPYSPDGKQVMLLNDAGTPISFDQYIGAKQSAALAGQVYDPTIAFATIQNVAGHPKYPTNVFYGGFSPRVALAWNPNFDNGILGKALGHGKTVVRGGYTRIFGRTQGIRMAGRSRERRRHRTSGPVHRGEYHGPVPGNRRSDSDYGFPHRNGRPGGSVAGGYADSSAAVFSGRERQRRSGRWSLAGSEFPAGPIGRV